VTKRSTRAGWRIVELVDGRWQTTATGDREALKALRDKKVFAIMHAEPHQIRHPGVAIGLYDANDARRDEYPTLPRLADGTRINWPDAPPGLEGADAVAWQPRAKVEA